MRLAQVLVNGVGINVHVWIGVHMVFNIRGYIYIFLRLWDIIVHTRPDGDLENLAYIFKIMGHNCAHAS